MNTGEGCRRESGNGLKASTAGRRNGVGAGEKNTSGWRNGVGSGRSGSGRSGSGRSRSGWSWSGKSYLLSDPLVLLIKWHKYTVIYMHIPSVTTQYLDLVYSPPAAVK